MLSLECFKTLALRFCHVRQNLPNWIYGWILCQITRLCRVPPKTANKKRIYIYIYLYIGVFVIFSLIYENLLKLYPDSIIFNTWIAKNNDNGYY